MAEIPFVDTHLHFWDLTHESLRYDWLVPDALDEDLGDFNAIKSQRYYPQDFAAETRHQNVSKVVHVQAAVGSPDPVEETRWLQRFTDDVGIPHGLIAYADLADPGVADVLAAHARYPALRGIRDLRYDDYLMDENWRRGYALLEDRGLVCCHDPLLEAMPASADLARAFPGITLCVDHAGFPRRRDSDYFRQWRTGMRQIAAAPNTVVKISGLGMCDHTWTTESIRPWVLECIDAFGTTRSFFGSNWPVDRLYSSYGDVIDAYAEIISTFTRDEQEALFHANAERIFHL